TDAIKTDDNSTRPTVDTRLTGSQKPDGMPIEKQVSSSKVRSVTNTNIAENMSVFMKRERTKQDVQAALVERRRQKGVGPHEDEKVQTRRAITVKHDDAVQGIITFVLSGERFKHEVKIGQMRQALSSLAGKDALQNPDAMERFKS